MFRLFIIPESLPYLFSRGNPGTAVVIILNDDGKKSLLKTRIKFICKNGLTI